MDNDFNGGIFYFKQFSIFPPFSKNKKKILDSPKKEKILNYRYPTHFWISLLVEELDVFPYQGNISCSTHRNHYPIPLIDSPLSILSKMLQYSYP